MTPARRVYLSAVKTAFLIALVVLLWTGAFAADAQSNKQTARLEFEKAEQMREALNGRPEAERTRRDYQHVLNAYRRVYYLSPASSKADASVMAVAELLAAMGRQFQPGEKDLHAAISQYEFLRREYPGSKYRVEALFTIGQIYKEDLHDVAEAEATFQEFVRRYPRDSRAAKAKETLAELEHPAPKKEPEEAHAAKATKPASVPQPEVPTVAPTAAVTTHGPLQLVTGIRHWSSPDSTRVAIDLDGEVQYQAGRVPNPDRIFFDLPNTKLISTLVGKSFDVQDGFLKKIRVGQYQRDSTRVVLEVEDLSEYSAFVLPNPYRLIIDIHGKQSKAPAQVANASPDLPADTEERSSRSIVSGNISAKPGAQASEARSESERQVQTAASDSRHSQTGEAVQPSANSGRSTAKSSVSTSHSVKMSGATKPALTTVAKVGPPKPESDDNDELLPNQSTTTNAGIKATSEPTSAPTAVAVAPRDKPAKKASKPTQAQIAAAREAAPTSTGDRSLIRALGLKIGRIVIDPGHGGHDTGTIGPEGLMEKELVLDVSLRLGRLLESRDWVPTSSTPATTTRSFRWKLAPPSLTKNRPTCSSRCTPTRVPIRTPAESRPIT